MSQNFENKKQLVEEIKELVKKSNGLFIVDYKGISVADDTDLRSAFRKEDVTYKVYKNRLVKKALEELNIKFEDKVLEGASSFAFAMGDALAPVRIIKSKEGTLKTMSTKAGFVDGVIYDENGVKALASIPAKEVLYTQLVGMLQMPIRKLAMTVNLIATK